MPEDSSRTIDTPFQERIQKGVFYFGFWDAVFCDLYLLIQGPFYIPLLRNMSKKFLPNILVFCV